MDRLPFYAIGLMAYYAAYLVYLIGKPEGWLLDPAGLYWLNDFSGVWTAGHLANSGHPALAYDIPRLCAEQATLHGGPVDRCYPWPYPPIFLPVAAALAKMSFIPAVLFWLGATGLLFSAVAFGLTRSWRGVVLMLAGPATLNVLYTGQNGFLTAALIGGGLALLPTRPVLGGIAFGLLSFKPHLGVMIPLALIAAAQWRAFVAAAVTVLALALVATAIYGAHLWLLFMDHFGSLMAVMQTHFDVSKRKSVFGMLLSLVAPSAMAAAVHGVIALTGAALVVVVWRSMLAYDFKASLLVAASLLASPYLFAYDMVALMVAQAFFIRHALKRGNLSSAEVVGIATLNLLQGMNGGLAALLLVALIVSRGFAERLQRSASSLAAPA